MIREALILAGGRGTRLSTITQDVIPKPLVEVYPGKSMLDIAIHGLFFLAEVKQISISICHLGDQIEEYLQRHYQAWKLDIIRETKPLGTGGSVRNAVTQGLNVPFLVTPADALINWTSIPSYLYHSSERIPQALVIWGVTASSENSQVPNNVWYEIKTEHIVACTTNKTENEIKYVDSAYKKRPELFRNATSAGIIVVNPQELCKRTKNDKNPVCLYKEWLPAWVSQGLPVLSGEVVTSVLDMGTPERLSLAKSLLTQP